jgi:hypothetical protein
MTNRYRKWGKYTQWRINKNEIMMCSGKWMELEIIMLNRVSQVQKDKYHMLLSYADCKCVTVW